MAQENICQSTVKRELGGNERRTQAGRMCLRTFWVENCAPEFHREGKRTSQT